jgi:ribosome-associated protein
VNTELLQSEIVYATARSGGKGGQNVNKVETKVEARWHVATSLALTEAEKNLVADKLRNHIAADGTLIVTHQTERSQLANKIKATAKLIQWVKKTLIVPKKRKPVSVPPSVVQNRAKNKRLHSEKKATRTKLRPGDF